MASCVLPKLLQHTITMLCSIHPHELQATLYSSSAGMKFHFWCGCRISMILRVTCGENDVSIDTQPSMGLPYRFLGVWIFHSPASGRPNDAGYLDPAIFSSDVSDDILQQDVDRHRLVRSALRSCNGPLKRRGVLTPDKAPIIVFDVHSTSVTFQG